MRISDWSSDVCSSDLAVRSRIYRGMVAAHRRPDHLPDLFGAAAQKRLLSRRSAAGCDVANRRDEARGIILLHEMPAAQRPMRHAVRAGRSEEHTSELQSLMRISYAVFCLKKKKPTHT